MEHLPIKFSNYEDCLMGVGQSFENVRYIYDREKILQKIKTQLKCSHKESLSFFENNINKDYGRKGPIFFCRIDFLEI
jgi:hypothetical protein